MTNDRYKEIVERVAAVKEQRGKMYRAEPKDIVPIEILEAVALLKAYRGYEGVSIEKKIDEYTDLMNYSAFIIERLENKLKGILPQKPSVETHPTCFGEYDPARPLCNSTLCEDRDKCKNESPFRLLQEVSIKDMVKHAPCYGNYSRSQCLEHCCPEALACIVETKRKKDEDKK